MSGYGATEARINRERKPNGNVCGSCGDECDGLLCADCRGYYLVTSASYEDEGEQERRTR